MNSATIVTREATSLSITVDPLAWEGLFDSLEVWRSRSGDAGPFEPLTGAGWTPARIPASIIGYPTTTSDGPYASISSLELHLLVNERTEVSISFSAPGPLLYSLAATQINAQASGLIHAFVFDNNLVLETLQPGSGASLRVVGGDAAPLLGLPTTEPESVSSGLDARIPLIHGQNQYAFVDVNGSSDFSYRTRFYNASTGLHSPFGLPFAGRTIGVSASSLIRGFVRVTDTQGRPPIQKVLIYNRFGGTQVEGRTIVGGSLEALTDETGYVAFSLVRGSLITVALAGSDLVRDVTVPTDPTLDSFDLLDPTLGKNDVFNVQRPNLDFAVRRSL